jgi:purine-binding chemotaxis protein CheW
MGVTTTSQTAAASAGGVRSDLTGKYLTFQLGKEEFGIRVLQVREIMGMQDITVVPQMPKHVKGVINLRGKVIPVIALRTKFGMEYGEQTARSCIIVVQVQTEGAVPLLVGLVVDGVSEVLQIAAADIEPTPDFGSGAVVRPYLLGMAKVRDKVKILLDIDEVAGNEETTILPSLAA